MPQPACEVCGLPRAEVHSTRTTITGVKGQRATCCRIWLGRNGIKVRPLATTEDIQRQVRQARRSR